MTYKIDQYEITEEGARFYGAQRQQITDIT